jgi:PAS domain S-box-containing protein
MITPSENNEWSELRNKIIGLGERSQRKSYYPELKKRFTELEKFKVLLDSSNDLIFLIQKKDGLIVDVNNRACLVLMMKNKEVLDSSITGVLKDETWKEIERNCENESGVLGNNSIKTILIKKDKSAIPVEITYSNAEFREEFYIIIVARDISERLRTEEELKNSEINLRTVFNSNRDAMFIHDEFGNVQEVNDQMLLMFGLDRISFQKFTIRNYSAAEAFDVESFNRNIENVMAGGERLFVWHALKPITGEKFWCEVFLRKIAWYGRPMILAIARDITEKKKTEEALKASEEKFRTLFNKMLDAFCVCEGVYDSNGNFVDVLMLDVNPAYEKMYNLKKEDIIGKGITTIAKRKNNYWFDIYDKVLKTGESISVENYSTAWDKYYSVCAFKFQEKQFAVVFEDITERKKAELIINKQLTDLETKNSEMERFNYTVSHDLRSPLITIKGFAGAIVDDIKSEKYERVLPDLKRIENAADKMQDLLEDLLELSRIGRIVNPPTEFSMAKISCEVRELLHGIIQAKGIEIKIAGDMPLAYGDIQRIREVIQNLVENAVKFMDKTEGAFIEIGHNTENGTVVFHVKDNGPGIAAEYYEKVFGLFNKLNAKTEGTGIGLALVKRIIELHNGQIWIESVLGQGTTFYFTIGKKDDNW